MTDNKKKKLMTAEDILKTYKDLSPEERMKLSRQGVTMPIMSAGGDDELKFGIRCRHCAEIALEFVGSHFMLPDGSLTDEPPVGILQIGQITWTQTKVSHEEINRTTPECQHCRGVVQTRNNLFFLEKNVVNIGSYTTTMNKAMKEFTQARQSGKKLGKSVPGNLASSSYEGPSEVISPEGRALAVEHSDIVGLDKAYADMRK